MYKSLHASRAVAAILVVLFHLGGAISAGKYFGIKAFSVPFAFGGAGVEFFFVLSGFIILTAHREDIGKPNRLASYIRKRILRIYPAYWIVFLAVCVLASVSLRHAVPADWPVLIKSLLLIPQDKSIIGGTGAPVIIVAWTLHYEMLFYSCFALLILSRWMAAPIALALLWIYFNYSGTASAPFPLSFLARDYILLFVMGLAVCGVAAGRTGGTRPFFYFSVGLTLFLVVALDTVANLHLLKPWRTLLYGLASSLIIFGLVRAEQSGVSVGSQRWMQTLGDSSYALYLIHYPLISALCKLAVAARLNNLGFMGASIAYLGILGACLFSAVAFNRYIEKPLAEYFRRPARSASRN